MKELFKNVKNSIVNNLGRLIAGLLFTLFVGFVTTMVIEPVKKVVEIPVQISEWQGKSEIRLQSIESRQMQFLNSVKKQAQTDSVIQIELEKINSSHQLLQREVGIVKTKLVTIRDELPALHQRFNDIENTVKHAQSFNEFASNYPSLMFSADSIELWQNKVFMHNTAYQSPFNIQ